jgi:hypothetical protein
MTSSKCSARIADLRLDQLPLLEPPAAQRERLHTISNPAEWQRIPELCEVLEAIAPTAGVYFIIEFKQNSDELISKVHECIAKYEHKPNVFWFSLEDEINKKLKKRDASVTSMYSVPGMLKVLGLYYTGLLPFLELEYDVLGLTIDEVSRWNVSTNVLHCYFV